MVILFLICVKMCWLTVVTTSVTVELYCCEVERRNQQVRDTVAHPAASASRNSKHIKDDEQVRQRPLTISCTILK